MPMMRDSFFVLLSAAFAIIMQIGKFKNDHSYSKREAFGGVCSKLRIHSQTWPTDDRRLT
jgi:hypothetical protein